MRGRISAENTLIDESTEDLKMHLTQLIYASAMNENAQSPK